MSFCVFRKSLELCFKKAGMQQHKVPSLLLHRPLDLTTLYSWSGSKRLEGWKQRSTELSLEHLMGKLTLKKCLWLLPDYIQAKYKFRGVASDLGALGTWKLTLCFPPPANKRYQYIIFHLVSLYFHTFLTAFALWGLKMGQFNMSVLLLIYNFYMYFNN